MVKTRLASCAETTDQETAQPTGRAGGHRRDGAFRELTQHSRPKDATHWSCRSMATETGVSSATVQRIWSARGLKPHLVKTFKISNDPRFEEKLVDVVGLYLNPPEKAVVLCMDEKSQIQALDRTQSGGTVVS